MRRGAPPRPARPRRRTCLAWLVPLLVLAVAGGTGIAHEDLRIVDATIELAPGGVATFPTAIHYHRVVGRYTVVEGASGVSLSLVAAPPDVRGNGGPDVAASAGAASTDAAPFDVLLADDLAASGTLNRLVRCCDEQPWTEAQLVVRNRGARDATIDLRVWAVHDDFAVVVDRAEPGAVSTPLVLFLALSIAAIVVVWRNGRRIRPGPAGGKSSGPLPAPLPGPVPASLRWSARLFIAALTIAAGLGIAGMVRYGAGPVDGMIAILADLPVPGGPFGARGASVMSVLLLAWTFAIGFWIRSLAVHAQRSSARPARLGLALGTASIAGGIAMGWTYASFGAPLLLGLVLGVPPIAVSIYLARMGPAPSPTAGGS